MVNLLLMVKPSFEYISRTPSLVKENSKVIIMFHGYGSNKEDLFSFSDYLDPSYLVISVQAPYKMDYNSYCWWSLDFDTNMSLKMDIKQAINSLNNLNNFIINELQKIYNFSHEQLYLCGFSQGCMIAYALSINFPGLYKKVIGLSGKMPKEIINVKNISDYKQHVFFCSHGILDQVIPIEIGRESSELLTEYGISHNFVEFQSTHGISQENFDKMTSWLENH